MIVKKNVTLLNLGVCGACHYDCVDCSHSEIRKQTKKYHMSLEEVERFLCLTEKSGYYIHTLCIQGHGDPLLWKHLEEGLRMFQNSPLIKNVQVITNGLSLERLPVSTFKHIDRLRISNYGSFSPSPQLQEKFTHVKGQVNIYRRPLFLRGVKKKDPPAKTPCVCLSPGPSIVGSKVFLTCTPSVFQAMAISGIDFESQTEAVVDLDLNYLDKYSTKLQGRMEICKYCIENSNRTIEFIPHQQKANCSTSFSIDPIPKLPEDSKLEAFKDILTTLYKVKDLPILDKEYPYTIKDCSIERRKASANLVHFVNFLKDKDLLILSHSLKRDPDTVVRHTIVKTLKEIYTFHPTESTELLLIALRDPIWEVVFTAVDIFFTHKEALTEKVINHLIDITLSSPHNEDHGSFVKLRIYSLLQEVGIELLLPKDFELKTFPKVVDGSKSNLPSSTVTKTDSSLISQPK